MRSVLFLFISFIFIACSKNPYHKQYDEFLKSPCVKEIIINNVKRKS